MLKGIKFFLVLVLIFISIAVFFRQRLCRALIVRATTSATGLELSIEDLNLNLLKNSLYMRGITLFNPPEFKNKVFGKIKEISIKYDLLDCLSGKLHLVHVRADISEINIVRNKEGNSNISTFKKKRSSKKSPLGTPPVSVVQKEPKRDKTNKQAKFLIDRLELSLKKVTFIDYKAGIGEPAVIIFKAGGPFTFKNVSDLGYVADSVSLKAGFRNLLNNLLGVIYTDVLKVPAETIKKEVEKIEAILIHKTK